MIEAKMKVIWKWFNWILRINKNFTKWCNKWANQKPLIFFNLDQNNSRHGESLTLMVMVLKTTSTKPSMNLMNSTSQTYTSHSKIFTTLITVIFQDMSKKNGTWSNPSHQTPTLLPKETGTDTETEHRELSDLLLCIFKIK